MMQNFGMYKRSQKYFLEKKKPKQDRPFALYNYSLLGITAIPIMIVGLINWLVDPQDIFKTPNYWGINHEKITKDRNDRLFKAVDVVRLQPNTIIVGSSRTKQGIDPESAVLVANNGDNVYNLALNGPNFYEVRRYIEHAIYNQPELEQIILGIDFFMFNQDLDNQPTFKESRLEKEQIIIGDAVQNLFSLDTLANSLEIAKASIESPATVNDNYGDNGFMPNRNYDNGETIWRFHQSIRLYYSLHSDYQFSESFWNDFKDVVRLCKENNIELKVFISPSHSTHWESIYQTKRGEVFNEWKRKLVEFVPLWDFSGYNSITTESIDKYMTNYVDNSHYTPEVGELILQRIYGYETEEIPEDFGILLTPENIEQHLDKIKSDRSSWIENHPEEFKLVKELYAEVNKNKDE